MMSCSVLDYSTRMLGFSIVKFKNENSGRFVKIFAMQKKDCFNKVISLIKTFEARITHKNFNKGYIVAFNFSKDFNCCLDSTEIAIFVTKIDDFNSKIEVISNNSLLAQMLSIRLFNKLDHRK
ncbi:MAG: hypothetical protein LBJ68_01455 [Endomicrobium sp.]|nr:hypothetical protein [Endomicrobium sp.]